MCIARPTRARNVVARPPQGSSGPRLTDLRRYARFTPAESRLPRHQRPCRRNQRGGRTGSRRRPRPVRTPHIGDRPRSRPGVGRRRARRHTHHGDRRPVHRTRTLHRLEPPTPPSDASHDPCGGQSHVRSARFRRGGPGALTAGRWYKADSLSSSVDDNSRTEFLITSPMPFVATGTVLIGSGWRAQVASDPP